MTNVLLFAALPFGQFELFYIVYCLLRSNYFSQLEDLINQVVSLQKRRLPKHLNSLDLTIPIMIIPADQQSTR